MTDRVKEAVFSSLGDLRGLTVLDLFAGSGSLGLEALSRGAMHAVFVESSRDAIVHLEANLKATGLKEQAEIVWSNVSHALERGRFGRRDLVFVDPPYATPVSEVSEVLEHLLLRGLVAEGGRIVVHRSAKESPAQPLGLTIGWRRDYGQSRILVYEHEEGSE